MGGLYLTHQCLLRLAFPICVASGRCEGRRAHRPPAWAMELRAVNAVRSFHLYASWHVQSVFEPGKRLSSHAAHQRLAFQIRNCFRLCHSVFFATCTENTLSDISRIAPAYAGLWQRRETKKSQPLAALPLVHVFLVLGVLWPYRLLQRTLGMLLLTFRCKSPTFTKTESARF
jgi:hypothetical protein